MHVAPAGEDVIVYPVIADPPSLGAVKAIVAEPEAVLVAVTEVGALGTVAGTTLDDEVDGDEVNNPLLDVTANV